MTVGSTLSFDRRQFLRGTHVGHHYSQQVSDKELRHTWTASFGHLKVMEKVVQQIFASYASAAPKSLWMITKQTEIKK